MQSNYIQVWLYCREFWSFDHKFSLTYINKVWYTNSNRVQIVSIMNLLFSSNTPSKITLIIKQIFMYKWQSYFFIIDWTADISCITTTPKVLVACVSKIGNSVFSRKKKKCMFQISKKISLLLFSDPKILPITVALLVSAIFEVRRGWGGEGLGSWKNFLKKPII